MNACLGAVDQVGVDRERFADLMVAEPEWLAAEFDAIIAANWPRRPTGFPQPMKRPWPRRGWAGVAWPMPVLRSAEVGRQRSPP